MLPGLSSPCRYKPLKITVAPGERIAFYTDGLFESAGDEAGRKQLEAQMTQSLAESLEDPIDQSLEHVMQRFDQIAVKPPKDDVLLLLAEPVPE